MKLTLSKRSGKRKSELTEIRFRKDIPAVIYSKGQPGEKVTVKNAEFSEAIRHLQKGFLPTTVFEIDLEGNKRRALVKQIQYHPTTYQVLHLDFLLLVDETPLHIKIPITCVGQADCIGIKLGGFLRKVKRHVKVRCLPKDVPNDFKINVKELKIGDLKRVRDLDVSENVRLLMPDHEVIVVIAKR